MVMLEALATTALFCTGVWLSAFFSGAETAYYRLSVLRVQVEAQTGSKEANRLLWFVKRPPHFVATVLIGNNVANYVTTLAIGLLLALVTTSASELAEILMTLAAAPIVFLAGELVPKRVNYLMPMQSMMRKIRLFRIVFFIVRPLSIPLVGMTRLLEHAVGGSEKSTTAVLGRPQVRELLAEGRLQGVFTDRQAELTNRLLRAGTRAIKDQMRPLSFEFVLPLNSNREETLAHAHAYGLTHVPLHRTKDSSEWVGTVRVADLLVQDLSPKELLRPLAKIEATTSRLSAIQAIRENGGGFGLVVEAGEPVGFVSLQALVRPLFRDAPAIAKPS